ncbi:MAG: clan AA aspartic protease [Gemmataceae bacterium]
MIVGTVNGACEIVLRLSVQDASGADVTIDAVLDTGFTGSLTLPPALITALNLPWRTRLRTKLGDGRDIDTDVYDATVVWDGVPRHIFAQSSDTTPLVGMRLLFGYDLRARLEPGGCVELEEIP